MYYNLEDLQIPKFGNVQLVTLAGKQIALHQALSSETAAKLGENSHSNFFINFSLHFQTGGRYKLFVTYFSGSDVPEKFKKMTDEQFLELDSVKQAIQVLKSLKY